jgi:hypothetical protein
MMFLTKEELAGLTGRTQSAAQVRVLRFMGIEHRTRPDGSVAVLRGHVEKSLGGSSVEVKQREFEPNWSVFA